MTQIIDRTDPAELETLRRAYMKKPKTHLQDLAARLGVSTEGRKCELVASILTRCAKLVHTTT